MIYGSKRRYKTQKDIEWIDLIMREYEANTMEEKDLFYIIYHALNNTRIGKFSYITVMSIALQGIWFMWGILALEGMFLIVSKTTLIAPNMIGGVGGSVILTLVMTMYTILKALAQKEKSIIGEVIHYVKVTYPEIKEKEEQKQLLAKRAEEEKRREMLSLVKQEAEKSEKKEEKLMSDIKEEETIVYKKKPEALNAKDIANLIGKI